MPKKKAAQTVEGHNQVFEFKITLDESRPSIWRVIRMGDGTLESLHDCIQAAMGWEESHLHQFIIEKKYYQPAVGADLMDFGFGPEVHDSHEVRLSKLLTARRKGFKFKYEYDFGDSWMHTVAYQGSFPKEPGEEYPQCVVGANACPPEDVGGVWGYAEKLQALAEPGNAEHDELIEWFGEFDPREFHRGEADARMRPRRRSRRRPE